MAQALVAGSSVQPELKTLSYFIVQRLFYFAKQNYNHCFNNPTVILKY